MHEKINIVKKLYEVYKSELQENLHDRHSEERKAADDAEDALFKMLTDGAKERLRQMISLRAEVAEMDTADTFADGLALGANLVLEILRPENPG